MIEKEKQNKYIEENKQKKKENEQTLKNKKLMNNNKNEIYIGDPNKFNVEMNNELIQTRLLIKKYNQLLQQEKLISHRLKEKVQELEENIKKLNNGILPKNENNIEMIDCLFSDDDFDDLEEDFEVKKEEEQEIQFPDKLNINRTKTSENVSNVPKLDLSQVLGKYKKPENLKIINPENKISHRSGNGEVIDKLNAQIKIYKQTIQRYKDRNKKFREQISILRNKNKILESTIKNNKFYNRNNNFNDESMNVNVSQIGDLNSNKNINSKNENENEKLDNNDIKNEKKNN